MGIFEISFNQTCESGECLPATEIPLHPWYSLRSSKSCSHLLSLGFVSHAHHLWLSALKVLGCAVELSDISCRRFLEQLISLFTFYNGPVHRAYMVSREQQLCWDWLGARWGSGSDSHADFGCPQEFPQEELDRQWDRYIEHIQKNTNDLHKIFNSLWNLDKNKVKICPLQCIAL